MWENFPQKTPQSTWRSNAHVPYTVLPDETNLNLLDQLKKEILNRKLLRTGATLFLFVDLLLSNAPFTARTFIGIFSTAPLAVYILEDVLSLPQALPSGTFRLTTTCVSPSMVSVHRKGAKYSARCGQQYSDDFQELQPAAVLDLANQLKAEGNIKHSQVSISTNNVLSDLKIGTNNCLVGARRRIAKLKGPTLPIFLKPNSSSTISLQCLPRQRCKWLHMCLKKLPYATKPRTSACV